jgi:pimeloyl-ACP methyl ester carboxylesterase
LQKHSQKNLRSEFFMPIIKLDDVQLFYQERGNPDSTEVLLALHAASANGDMLGWALPRNHAFRIIVPDQRGHGKTPNPAPNFHLARFIDDMLNLLEALEIKQVHGIGYSLGGAVLLGIAQSYPEKLKSLVIIGATHRAPTPEQLTELAGPLHERTGLVLETTHPERGIRVGWHEDLVKLRKLRIPVALIGGDRDEVQSLEAFVELYNTLPQSQLLIVPNCYHLEYHTNSLVRTFLNSHYESII